MPEPVVTVASVVINVKDYDTEKAFWGAMLGADVAREFPGFFCWFEPQHEGGISVALQLVPDPTPGRRRLHLDMSVEDVDVARDRIIELGGSHLEDFEVMGFSWRVMADPEGNEFCLAVGAAAPI